VVVAALCGYLIWRGPLEVALSAMLVGGVLITPHTTVCDATLFLPALLLARKMESAMARALAAFALTPCYLLLPRGGLQVAVMAILVAAVFETHRGESSVTAVSPYSTPGELVSSSTP